jgi:hypothetical protein
VSFRHGRYAFTNVLIGSLAIALVAALPLTLFLPAMLPPGALAGGLDLGFLLFAVGTRAPVFVLVSIGLIKGARRLAGQ